MAPPLSTDSPTGSSLQAVSERTTLLIADDSEMGCQLLKNELVRSHRRFEVVACALTGSGIIEALDKRHIDLALISEHLQDGPFTGLEVMSRMRTSYPKTRVVLLLRSAPAELVVDAFRAGAKGVFCRTQPFEALRKCIESVHKGQIWVNSQQLYHLLEAFVHTAPLRLVNPQGRRLLGNREDEVAALVAQGLSNREVAQRLGLTEHTVSNYLFRIYNKLGISSRVELVLYVLRQRQQA